MPNFGEKKGRVKDGERTEEWSKKGKTQGNNRTMTGLKKRTLQIFHLLWYNINKKERKDGLMHLTWNGHSCFTLEIRQGTLVLDPYRPGSVPGLPNLKLEADGVYCSHQHDDHAGAELVTLSGRGHTVQVEEIETYHDPEQGALRGKNTIRIFTAEGLRVAHLGDLGCELTQEQAERLTGLDALLFPVGGFYTIDAQQAHKVVEQLKPRVAVPMHYRGENFGYDVIGPLEDYLALCSDVVRYPGNTLELTADTPAQTAVLTCPVK